MTTIIISFPTKACSDPLSDILVHTKRSLHGIRWNNLGYLGSFITFMGATIFWISTIVGVPGVLPEAETHYVEWDILFWLTQVQSPVQSLMASPFQKRDYLKHMFC